jgi:hypothetical protein
MPRQGKGVGEAFKLRQIKQKQKRGAIQYRSMRARTYPNRHSYSRGRIRIHKGPPQIAPGVVARRAQSYYSHDIGLGYSANTDTATTCALRAHRATPATDSEKNRTFFYACIRTSCPFRTVCKISKKCRAALLPNQVRAVRCVGPPSSRPAPVQCPEAPCTQVPHQGR